MPFKSQAQRGFMYSEKPKLAKEFEAATPKDAALPEHVPTPNTIKLPRHIPKFAEGGEVPEDQKSQEQFKQGFNNGINGDWNKLKEMFQTKDSSGTTKGYAKGGEVSNEDFRLSDNSTLQGFKDLMAKHQAGEDIHEKKPMETPYNVDMSDSGPTHNQGGTFPSDFRSNASTKNYAGGGDVNSLPMMSGGYSGAGSDNASALMSLIKQGMGGAFMPGGAATNAIAQGSADAAQTPDLAGVMNAGAGTNLPETGDSAPPIAPLTSIPGSPVSQSTMPPTPQPGGTPPPSPTPSLSDTTAALNKTPDTNYDFYKNMGAGDRAALYKQLSDQQKGPGSLIAQGIGGLGDAMSALGGGKSSFLKDIQGQQEKRKEGAMGAFDTQREQKLQDMNANVAAMSNDPKSPLNVSARAWVSKAMGTTIPSGMTVVQLEKLVPGIGDMMMKQMTTAEAARSHKETEGIAKAAQQEKQDVFKSEHPILNYLNPVGGGAPTSPISNANAPHGIPDLGSTFNGGKVLSVKRIK